MSDESGGSHDLLLAFDTEDAEFARGFEAGRIWALLDTGERICQTIHANNAEMAIRMCEAKDRRYEAKILDDIWCDLTVEGADDA